MSKTQEQKQRILEALQKARGAAVSLGDLAIQTRLPSHQVLTLLGQLKDQVECASKATMESTVSMKWEDVDSRWRLKGVEKKAANKWPPRPGSVPFGSETAPSLEERVKRGKLKEDKLLLAAWLGHEGATQALGSRASAAPSELGPWLVGLGRWKDEVRVRGLAAAARKALDVFAAAKPGDERPRRAVDAALNWAKGSQNASAALATGTALGAEEAAKEAPEGAARAAANAAFRLGILVSAIDAAKKPAELEALVLEVGRELVAALGEQEVRGAVRDELGPWALS